MEMVLRESVPEKANYKLKINGFHIVGTREKIEDNRKIKKKDNLLDIFEIAYKESKEMSLIGDEQVSYINDRMKEMYKSEYAFENLIEMSNFECDFVEYIEKKLKQKVLNLLLRKKRIEKNEFIIDFSIRRFIKLKYLLSFKKPFIAPLGI